MKFREAYLTGKTDFEAIFDLTDEWNFSDETCTLREYLGLTEEEEDVWISQSDEALEELMETEKNRRLFFVDIDGTILTDTKELTDRNARILDLALKEGHGIILTTGRAPASTIPQARRMNLLRKGCYMICCNGAEILDSSNGQVLFSKGVPVSIIRACFEAADTFGIYIQTYDRDLILAQEDTPYLHTYSRILGMDYKIVENAPDALPAGYDAPKLLCMDRDHEKLDRFRDHLNSLYADQLDIFFSQETYLEIVSKDVNKGNAVTFMADLLHVPLALCVAAGDSENDLSMIRTAGIGVAMANADEKVRQAADHVTLHDNNHDGVAEILETYVLAKPSDETV